MGEVIHFDFEGRRKTGGTKSETKPVERREIGIVDGDKADYLVRLLQFRVIQGNKILSLPASPSSLQQSRRTVKSYETEELISWLENTTEIDWKKRPAFFQAILGELELRLVVR